jgi:ubiquinone/menaquinone biosynthesis C-methylase UbiE
LASFYFKLSRISTVKVEESKMIVDLGLDNSELAKNYDELSDSQFNNGLALLEKLQLSPEDKVLDIGCGTGRLGRYLSGILDLSGRYIGIDPLEERIKIANEKNFHPNVVYRIGYAEDLGTVHDNSIDIICLNAVFHWVLHKEAALREVIRVLKPGGRVGISTGAKELNYHTGMDFITSSVLKREPYRQYVQTKEKPHLTTTELIRMITKVGLKVIDIQVKTVKRTHPTAKDVIRHCEASSFGNFLSNAPESLREQIKADIEIELEQYRRNEGIQLSRHTIFAIAKKRKGLSIVHKGEELTERYPFH